MTETRCETIRDGIRITWVHGCCCKVTAYAGRLMSDAEPVNLGVFEFLRTVEDTAAKYEEAALSAAKEKLK